MIAAVMEELSLAVLMGTGGGVVGDSKSVGRLRRIVLGTFWSADADVMGTEAATPTAESSEIREVFDLAA